MKLSVISPTFDEAQNVCPLVEHLTEALRGIDYEIVIVDDNSPDLTWSVAQEIAQRDPRVRVLRRFENPGLGAAVIDGFNAAQGEVVACIDADLQHDPTILPKMLDQLGQDSDVVVGSRYVAGGGVGDWNWLRRIESRTATRLAWVFLGAKLEDPMSGFFLMWRKDFSRVQAQLDGRGYKILLEILAKLHPAHIREVPYTFQRRTAGRSKLSGKIALQYLEQLWRLSTVGRFCSGRFVKFAAVGSSGVVVNLAAMAFLLHLTDLRDWRASATASVAANLSNYILNNYWTFSDRLHRGFGVVKGYLFYLLMTGIGLSVTTAAYAALTWSLARISLVGDSPRLYGYRVTLICQFIAILLGTFSNYQLNRKLTWSSSILSTTSKLQPRPRTFVARLFGF